MTIKSQDDLNQPETHSTEVLLESISKLETTAKELEKVKKQLFVAITGLGVVQDLLQAGFTRSPKEVIEHTFNEIKELDK
jgi:hypothetical protein